MKLAAAVSVGASTARAGATAGVAGWPDPPAHFVLVHGAWHGAWCWYKIAAGLVRAGQGVSTLDLPAAGIDPAATATVTRQVQVDRVLAAIDAVGEPVILVGHSAGGPVVSAVAEAAPEKIAKLVYLSAFLLPDGVLLVQVTAADTASVLNGALIVRLDLGTIDVEPSARRDAFYNRSDDADVALADTLLRPVSLQALVTPVHVGTNFASVPALLHHVSPRPGDLTPGAGADVHAAPPRARPRPPHERPLPLLLPPKRSPPRPPRHRPGLAFPQ